MKTVSIVLKVILLTVAGQFAQACPGLDTTPGVYTEVAVPCINANPDFSQKVAVNQADTLGGECRVQPDNGNSFYVIGSELVLVNSMGQIQRIGTLVNKPSCDKMDDQFYSSWNRVLIGQASDAI